MTDSTTNDAIWNVIYDILDSLYMADTTPDKSIWLTVSDYVTNHYDN